VGCIKSVGSKMRSDKIDTAIMLAFNDDIVNSYNKNKRQVLLKLDANVISNILNSIEN
jgi:hypothetical protein